MQGLHLTDAQLRQLYVPTLATTHTEQVELQILDLSGNVLKTMRPRANSGQVNIDTGSDVTRSATLTFLDPDHTLMFDTDSASSGAVYFDNMVKIRVGVRVPTLGVVWCSVFTGPLVKFDRTGDEV